MPSDWPVSSHRSWLASARSRRSCWSTWSPTAGPSRSRSSSTSSSGRVVHAGSSRSRATSAIGSRCRSAFNAWPRPSTPVPPSSMRSSGRWARRSSCVQAMARSRWPTRPVSACSPTSRRRPTREILDQLDDPDGIAPSLGSAGGPIELPDASGSRSLDRDRDVPGDRRGRARRQRRRDDRRHARRHRGAPARGRPRDVHRRPVARAPHAGHDDLRRGQAARPLDIDARRGDPAGHLPRHPRGSRATAAAGRGCRRAQPFRRRRSARSAGSRSCSSGCVPERGRVRSRAAGRA